MCGIAGFVSLSAGDPAMPVLKRMADSIAHRGPDGEAYYSNPEGNVHFAHRRLCIIDTSEAAAQPLRYLDRYTILHNGEIYNYPEIRDGLEKQGCLFRTHSDTEVIVAAFHIHRENALHLFDGMFAFVIWDEQEKQLFMARDRFGEKPLYYYNDHQNKRFVFGSEMKAIHAYGLPPAMNHRLLLQFLALGYKNEIEGTNTYDENIFQLPPAYYCIVSIENEVITPELTAYWDLDKEHINPLGPESAAEKFLQLLNQSVKRRLRSDVPVGATLSGGIDSSSIVSIFAKLSTTLPICYSAVFPGFNKDESSYIKELQQQLSFKCFNTTPDAADIIHDFEKMMHHQEQPVSSASVYAQYKVFELAKINGTTVLLDGQGADELLAGYEKYIPVFLRELCFRKSVNWKEEKNAFDKNGISSQWSWKHLAAAIFPGAAAAMLTRRDKIHLKHADWLTTEYTAANATVQLYKPVVEKLNDLLYYNMRQNGLPELLRYADRNAMAHGRESRFPFLSHELAEFVFSLPSTLKMRKGWTKWLLRTTMAPNLPPSITWRTRKIAFEPPQKMWMASNMMQEYITAAKEKLVNERIARKEILKKKNQPHEAHAAENTDWRILVAAQLIRN
jgi:asparagine synthase (glutamine-hydrolysing)